MRNIYAIFSIVMALFTSNVQGQSSVSTVPSLTGGTGQAGITFNLSAMGTSVIIDSIHVALYGGPGIQQLEVWYNPAPINGSVAAPNITTANGWVQLGTAPVNVTNNLLTPPQLYGIPLNLSLPLQAGDTFGFFVGSGSTSTSSVTYTSYSAGNPTSVTDGVLTIHIDPNAGYGGPLPSPPNNPRQFTGTVFYHALGSAPWDAALNSLAATNPCDSITPVVAEIANFGDSVITNLTVDWTVNGIPQTPFSYAGVLDTIGGSGSHTATVSLGSVNVGVGGVFTVDAWVSNPNGNLDTINNNDTLQAVFFKGLAGTYNIGGPGADFYSYTAAVNMLNQVGVCGPVTFLVNDSTYDEQVVISNFPGMSSANHVTFESASGDSSLSVLTTSSALSATNYTLSLQGASFVTFRGITIENTSGSYTTAVELLSAPDITFEHCVFRNTATSTSTNYTLIDAASGISNRLALRNNVFDGGSYGLYYYGTSTTARAHRPVITGNEFYSYYNPIRLYYVDSAIVRNNLISTTASPSSTWYGLYSGYSSFFEYDRNKIEGSAANAGYGIYMTYNTGSAAKLNPITNNMIIMGSPSSTSGLTGIYLSSTGYNLVAGNSIRIEGSTASEGVYTTGSGSNQLVNNNIANYSAGYALYYVTGYDFNVSDYNNIYSPTGNAGYFNGALLTLADVQNATQSNFNSISVDPAFVSATDLHTCADSLHNVGMTVAGLTHDFDGDLRSPGKPDIGADEFMPVKPDLGPDTSFCAGGIIGENMATGTSFAWSTGSFNHSIPVTATGTYTVLTTGSCGSGADTINVTIIPAPLANFGSSLSYLTATFSNATVNGTSYSWNFGDGTTSTESDPVHIYSTSGTKTVTLIATNECGSDTFTTTILLSVPNVGEIGENGVLNVYPNPSDGMFQVAVDGVTPGTYNVIVSNLQGQVVYESRFVTGLSAGNTQVDLSGFSRGVYLMTVTGPDGTGTARIIID